MFAILRTIRGVAGLIAAWQIFMLLPVLTWITAPSAITSNMMVVLVFKLFIMVLFGAVFFGMRSLINHLHIQRHSEPHPALAKSKFAL